MKTILISTAAFALFAAGETLSTDYSKAGTLRIESSSTMSMETTSRVMEIDGEPIDNPRFGGGGGSTETRRVVQIDQFLEQADGAPTRVRRTFEAIDGTNQMSFGDQENEVELECPLEELTLELTQEDGEVKVAVVDGVEPDDDATLEGHRLDLDLDALLPEGEVEAGSSWDLDAEAIQRALGLHVQSALFQRPPRPEGEGGEGRGGGRRGGFGGGGGASTLLARAEWEGKATISSMSEEHDGVMCVVVELELECEGDMPEFGGGGRGGRGGGFALASTRPALENDFSAEAEGTLYYSLADRRPVALELEGKLETNRTMERETQRGSIYSSTTQEGTFTCSVTVRPGSTD